MSGWSAARINRLTLTSVHRIEYFHKFDYSDDVSAVNQSHKSPASVASRGTIADVVAGSITEFPIQLHAHVYAIADKVCLPRTRPS